MNKKNQKATIIVLSILTAVFCFMWIISIISIISLENEYNDLDQEWCEIVNDDYQLINQLLDDLEYYDPIYNEVQRLDILSCFDN